MDVDFSFCCTQKHVQQRKKFTPEEDEKLKQLVGLFGSKKWESIASQMPGRTGRQCRDRYKNYLVPGYFNGQWTQEEDDLLKEKYLNMGPQWSKMTAFFDGRSANSLKNRWNYFVCRQPEVVALNNILTPPSEPSESNSQKESDDSSDLFQFPVQAVQESEKSMEIEDTSSFDITFFEFPNPNELFIIGFDEPDAFGF